MTHKIEITEWDEDIKTSIEQYISDRVYHCYGKNNHSAGNNIKINIIGNDIKFISFTVSFTKNIGHDPSYLVSIMVDDPESGKIYDTMYQCTIHPPMTEIGVDTFADEVVSMSKMTRATISVLGAPLFQRMSSIPDLFIEIIDNFNEPVTMSLLAKLGADSDGVSATKNMIQQVLRNVAHNWMSKSMIKYRALLDPDYTEGNITVDIFITPTQLSDSDYGNITIYLINIVSDNLCLKGSTGLRIYYQDIVDELEKIVTRLDKLISLTSGAQSIVEKSFYIEKREENKNV